MTDGPTDPYGRPEPLGSPGAGRSDDTGTAKVEARRVADTATSAGADVAETAKEQVSQVATEAKDQAASLLETVRVEVGEQANTQQQRVAEALHGLSKELGAMASSSPESGWVTDLVHEASRRGGEVAHWLSDREPADLLEAARSYARRRPVTFLALCGLAGVLAGRLTRSTVATRTSLDSPDHDSRPRSLAQEVTPTPVKTYPEDPLVAELESSRAAMPIEPNPLARTGGDPIR